MHEVTATEFCFSTPAAKLVLEPIFEADFEDSAYGYRPGRQARGAVQAVHRALCDGYTDVVDADLSKYFDSIPHDQLMKSVARRISDGRMLKLIKRSLKRLRGNIRGLLRPGNQARWGEVAVEVNRVLRGWAGYNGYGTRFAAYKAVDRHVALTVRHFLRRRHKVLTRGTRRFPAHRIFGELGIWSLVASLRPSTP